MIDLGVVKPGSTLRIPFSTFDKDDGSSITMTNFAVADILIYKDGSTTERASTAGYTATTDFDAKTGKHFLIIDLADNTTADFFAAGSEYHVALDSVTVDAVNVGGWMARFRIGYPGAVLDTTIATLSTQTSFTLTTGPAEDDALNGMWAVIHDAASAVQASWVQILDYTGSTKTVTLVAGAKFTVAAKDNISIMYPVPLQPTTTGRTLTVESDGMAHADVKEILGDGQSATDLKDLADDGYDPTTNAIGANMLRVAGTLVDINSAQLGVNIVNIAGSAVNTAAAQIGTQVVTHTTAAKAEIESEVNDALTAFGTSTLTAAGVRTAVGLASANLDTQLAALAGYIDTEVASILAAVDTEVAAIKAKTDSLTFTVAGKIDANMTHIADGAITDTADRVAARFSDFFNQTSAGQTVATVVSTLDAAGIRTAVGLAAANLDTQLTAIDDFLDTEVAAIKAKTDTIPVNPAAVGDAMTLTSAYDFAKGTVAMAEAYRGAGAAGTPVQVLYEILQNITEFAVASTTKTVKKLDGTTTAKTYTLDSATVPTSITETT